MMKRPLPKPVLKRRLFKIGFWAMFCICLFLSVVAIVRVGNSQAESQQTMVSQQPKKEYQPNLAASDGAQTFAKNFANAYLTWDTGDDAAEDHAKRLKPFLANGIDEQAGLVMKELKWRSDVDYIQIWRVYETGDRTANMILRVEQSLKKTKTIEPSKKEIKKAKKKDKKPPKPKEKTIEKGPYEKFLNVSIKTDGEGFAVNKIPHFVPKPGKADITVENEEHKDAVNDDELEKDIQSFLKTFFKVYTTGEAEELSYYTKIPQLRPLTDVVSFQEVKDFHVYPTDQFKTYEVKVHVVMASSQEDLNFVYPYTIDIQKEDDRWLVTHLKY